MIRPARPDDEAAAHELLEAIGLFPPAELAEVRGMLSAWLAAGAHDGRTWLVREDEALVGIAYVVPEVQTDRTWNLLLIATRPGDRGAGRGAALLAAAEDHARSHDARMLIVETSGTAPFERTRRFYAREGYEREATVRDFYADGDDKVVLRKRLVG